MVFNRHRRWYLVDIEYSNYKNILSMSLIVSMFRICCKMYLQSYSLLVTVKNSENSAFNMPEILANN